MILLLAIGVPFSIKRSYALEIKGLYDAVMKLIIVNISLKPQDGDDPQLIFESLNSTGLGLDESDKIRNYILIGMPAAKQETFYKKYWEPLERLVSHNDMKTFIRYYLSVKTRDLFKEDKLYFRFSKLRLNEYVKNCESWGESEILIIPANPIIFFLRFIICFSHRPDLFR